jgi:hypothetical protein
MAISVRQEEFITSLVKTRYNESDQALIFQGLNFGDLTGGRNGTASQLISKLLAMPAQGADKLPEALAGHRSGVNSNPGACATCGHTVASQAGFYFGPFSVGNRWKTHHKDGECLSTPAPAPVVVEEGFYRVGDDIIQVYMTKNSRLAGKALSPAGKFEYRAGAVATAATGERITEVEVAAETCMRKYGALPGSQELLDMAVRYGTESGECMFCANELTDPRSNPNQGGKGYGPVCAKKYSLPWG